MVEMVELVIKIPEEVYEKIQKRKVNQYDIDDICQSVFEGTLLPKGHGRIIDADVFEKRLMSAREYYIGEKADNFDLRFAAGLKAACLKLVDSPTIIEADMESGGDE